MGALLRSSSEMRWCSNDFMTSFGLISSLGTVNYNVNVQDQDTKYRHDVSRVLQGEFYQSYH